MKPILIAMLLAAALAYLTDEKPRQTLNVPAKAGQASAAQHIPGSRQQSTAAAVVAGVPSR